MFHWHSFILLKAPLDPFWKKMLIIYSCLPSFGYIFMMFGKCAHMAILFRKYSVLCQWQALWRTFAVSMVLTSWMHDTGSARRPCATSDWTPGEMTGYLLICDHSSTGNRQVSTLTPFRQSAILRTLGTLTANTLTRAKAHGTWPPKCDCHMQCHLSELLLSWVPQTQLS